MCAMGRPPCCDQANVKKGAWTPDEDAKMLAYVANYGIGNWTLVPQKAGLNRCGKSCRLRWTNYLRPELKHHDFTPQEEQLILDYHKAIGSRWSLIAKKLSGRTDNDVKNHWNTKLKKKLCKMGIDHITHKPLSQVFKDYGRINNNAAAAGDSSTSTLLQINNNIINSFALSSTSWPSSDQVITMSTPPQQQQQPPMMISSNFINCSNNSTTTPAVATTPPPQRRQERPLIVEIISCPSPTTTNSSCSSSCSFNGPHPHPSPPFCSSNNICPPPPPPSNNNHNNNNNLLLPCLSTHNSNDFDHQYRIKNILQLQEEEVGAGVLEKVDQMDTNYFDHDQYYYYAPRQLEMFTRNPELANDDDQISVGSKDDDQLIMQQQQHSMIFAATHGYDDGNIGQGVANSLSSSSNDNNHKIAAASSFVEEILDQDTKMRMEFPDFFTHFFNY